MIKEIKKSGQEEIVGFAIILILIAVIFIVFLGLGKSDAQKQELEDFETTSFLSAMLETTTTCEKNGDFLSVKDLIFECPNYYFCLDGNNSCEVLNETVEEILEVSWDVSEESSVKGYDFEIFVNDEERIKFVQGNITKAYKGASQNYAKTIDSADIYLKIYY